MLVPAIINLATVRSQVCRMHTNMDYLACVVLAYMFPMDAPAYMARRSLIRNYVTICAADESC